MNTDSGGKDELTERILGCAFRVSKALGTGFLEKVYENALLVDLKAHGLQVEQQRAFQVHYLNVRVGEFIPDMLIEGEVLVELKCVRALDETHLAQCLNYLRVTGLRRCLLLNFQSSKLEIRRISL